MGRFTIYLAFPEYRNDPTLDERKSKITEGEDSLLYFFANAVVAAVYKDTVYYAVKNLIPCDWDSTDYPEDAKKVFIYSYDLFTDERKELLNFAPFNDSFDLTHFLLVANDNYLIYDDDVKHLCSFDLATQERRQILINGEPTHFADGRDFTNTLGRCMTKGDILLCKQNKGSCGSRLYYYNLKTKNVCEASTEDYLAAGHLCGNSLFFLKRHGGEFFIAKSNDSPKKLFSVGKSYEGLRISGYSDGIIISVAQGNYPLYYIDPIGNMVELATECGHRTSYGGGLFSKSSISHIANPFIRIGRTVYFKVGDDNYRKVSIDRAHEVEQIPSKDTSGRIMSESITENKALYNIFYIY